MQNKKYQKITLGLQILGISLMGIYTLQINLTSTKGYNLRKLQEERGILLSQEEELNLKISRAQNFNNLEKTPEIQNMIVYSGNESYFKINSEFAKK